MTPKQIKVSYKLAKYTNDEGLWTIIRVTEADCAKTHSEHEALTLIKLMETK